MEILDRDLLLRNVDGDGELLAEIVALFFDSSVETLEAIREAVARADAVALERSAHELKGALANVGANAASDAARELETLGRNGVATGLEDSLQALEEECEKLKPELKQLVASVSGNPPGA